MSKTARLALKLAFGLALLWICSLASMAGATTCTPGSTRYVNTHVCCANGTEYQELMCNSTGTGWYQTGVTLCFPTTCFGF